MPLEYPPPQRDGVTRQIAYDRANIRFESGLEVEKLIDIPCVLRTAGVELGQHQVRRTHCGYVSIADAVDLRTLDRGHLPGVPTDDDVDRLASSRRGPDDGLIASRRHSPTADGQGERTEPRSAAFRALRSRYMRDAQLGRHFREAGILGPQPAALYQRRREEVGVHPSDSLPRIGE